MAVYVVIGFLFDVVFSFHSRFRFAFFLFIVREAMIFLALLVSVLWFEDVNVSPLSS